MARTRKSYTPEFKLQAVKMVLEQKLSVADRPPIGRQREPAAPVEVRRC